jgi:ribonuclease BN (tRNA processing enzyme)
MELTFLGRGAGFNPNEGSTSAYFFDNGELFFIDAGESIFRAVLTRSLLDSAKALNLFITHTHSDHVGSLGSLILYAYAMKKIPVNILFDDNMGYLSSIRALLVIYGITEKMYHFVNVSDFDGKYSLFSKVRYVQTTHCK